MSFLDITIFTLRFYIPSIFGLLFRVYALGYKSKKSVVIGFVVYSLYMLLVPSLLINFIGYGTYTHIAFYVMTLGSLSVLIFSTDSPVKTMFLQFVPSVAIAAMSATLSMVRRLTDSSYAMLLLALFICSALLFVLCLRYFAKPLRFIGDHLYGGIPVMMIPFLVMLISVWIPTYPAQNFANYPVSCTVITLMIQGTFFLYIYTLYRNLHTIMRLTREESQRELLQLSLAATHHRLALMDEAVGQMSIRQHDQRHLNATLLDLLRWGEVDKAAALIAQQTAQLPQRPTRYCENIAVNAAVSYYSTLAMQRGIRCDLRLDIPEVLHCSELAVSMVISNLMENAIHACESLAPPQERRLSVSAVYTGQLILEAENPYCGEVAFDEHGYPITDAQDHGKGSASVRAFVEEMDGEIFYNAAKGIFTVKLLV